QTRARIRGQSLTKVGALKQGQVLAQDVQLKLGPGSDSSGLRLIAFVQEARQGRVLGAASMPVNTRETTIRRGPPSLPARLSNSAAVRYRSLRGEGVPALVLGQGRGAQ